MDSNVSMADILKKIDNKEQAPAAAPVGKPAAKETPASVSASRQEIAGALTEGGEFVESAEVREVTAEAGEVKGDGAAKAQQKKDDGKAATAGAATTAFTFDEKNLPPVPEMIKKIENMLRAEIRSLERDARRFQGGLFRKPNMPKYSETLIEIRKKNVLLKRLVSMAGDMLKKLFLQMFGKKNT